MASFSHEKLVYLHNPTQTKQSVNKYATNYSKKLAHWTCSFYLYPAITVEQLIIWKPGCYLLKVEIKHSPATAFNEQAEMVVFFFLTEHM